jgi:nicotinamidase-related amidase
MLTLFLPVKPRYALLKMAAATTIAKRAVGKLRPETTAMLLVDIQERFRPLIYNSETVVQTARYMTSVAKALDIPVVVTQQYTKVFGETVKECFAEQQDLEATPIYEKKLFSMCTEEVASHLSKLNRSSYIMFGIEAHVCVQQTALDLLEVRHHSFAVA